MLIGRLSTTHETGVMPCAAWTRCHEAEARPTSLSGGRWTRRARHAHVQAEVLHHWIAQSTITTGGCVITMHE